MAPQRADALEGGVEVIASHVLAVERAVRYAADCVREEGTPRFLELRTYRFRAHSRYDPELYRTKEEIEDWRLRCPIRRLEDELGNHS